MIFFGSYKVTQDFMMLKIFLIRNRILGRYSKLIRINQNNIIFFTFNYLTT